MKEFYASHRSIDLSQEQEGTSIRISGWVHQKRRLGKLVFIDLRDPHGLIQLIFDQTSTPDLLDRAEKLRLESVIQVEGSLRARTAGMENTQRKSGSVEIIVSSLTLLSEAETLPFLIYLPDESLSEDLRLKYRYLEMRKGPILENLRLRHRLMQSIRNFFSSRDFVEVETPILGKSTPAGARDYLVPSRIHPGHFYALPQSPQQYKQLLMIGGLGRYFQIAKCFRDEDSRADRQPEFTQLDIEASFISLEEMLLLNETFLSHVFKECIHVDLPRPFPRISYQTALEEYGSDKPDLRFELKIQQAEESILSSSFPPFKEALKQKEIVRLIRIPNGAVLSRKILDDWSTFASTFSIRGIAYLKEEGGQLGSSLAKFFPNPELLYREIGIESRDLVCFAYGQKSNVLKALGHLRKKIAKELNLIDKKSYRAAWIVDFPLFLEEGEGLTSAHHPFTAPQDEDLPLLDQDPLSVRAKAYDLVVNGYELGGGSLRIYDPHLQKKIFESLSLSKKEIEEKFGFFIEALSYGTPPHGGIAYGLDRLMMLFIGGEAIRDVISFPKTVKGVDLMCQAPSQVSESQLKELSIELRLD